MHETNNACMKPALLFNISKKKKSVDSLPKQ